MKIIRKIAWNLLYKKLYKKAVSNSGLYGYPMVAFIELEGEKHFLELGDMKFRELLESKLEELMSHMVKGIEYQIEEAKRISTLSDEEWRLEFIEAIDKMHRKEDKERIEDLETCEQLIKEYELREVSTTAR